MPSDSDHFATMQQLALDRLEEHGIRRPPVNVYSALSDVDVQVDLWNFSNDNLAGCYMSEPAVPPSIAINAGHDSRKRRFTAAHEYKHHLVDRNRGELLCVDDRSERMKTVERMANAFAARFLVPEHFLRPAVTWLNDLMSVSALADLFGVNYRVMVYRLHNTGIINARQRDALLSPRGRRRDSGTYAAAKLVLRRRSAPQQFALLHALAQEPSVDVRCEACGASLVEGTSCWMCGVSLL